MPCRTFLLTSLTALSLAPTSTVIASETSRSIEVIQPTEQTTDVRRAAIDGKRFELGVYTGALSVEDFNTNAVAGLSLNYHISTRFLAQLNYGVTTVERATFEEISGGDFLADDDRDFNYQSLLAGYRLMDGRSFLGARRKFNSHLYLLAGPAHVSFAGEDNTGVVVGINYKTVLTEWLTVDLDFRDIIVERDFLGTDKRTHNIEMTLGLKVLF